MKLEIVSSDREHAILVCDEDRNDIAEFFHSDHATVGQSYETALMLANALVAASLTLASKTSEHCASCYEGQIAEWISYADKLERTIELICGTSKDKLIQLQAQEGLRLVKPSLALTSNQRTPQRE